MLEITYAIVFIVLASVIAITLFYEKHTKISASPVMPWVINEAMVLLGKHTNPEKSYKVIDLGSGWGASSLKLCKTYKNAKIDGYELSPWPFWISKIRTRLQPRATVTQKDFFKDNISSYDIVFCYLSPHHMSELIPQFETLKKGSFIVSCSFPIEGWTAIEKSLVKGPINTSVYIYCVE